MKAIIAVPATLALVYRAYSKKSLTPGGIITAAATAACHAYHPWNLPFVLLCVFFLAGSRATHVKEGIKSKLTLKAQGSSGGEGPRTHIQVLANSLTASILCILHARQLHQRTDAISKHSAIPEGTLCYSWGSGDLLLIGIIANYACVAADTFSSELGILARSSPRLITSWTLRKVPRGTNGGVTLEGLGAGLLGSATIVTAAMFFLPFCNDATAGKVAGGVAWTSGQRRMFMAAMTAWGALGSVVDSIMGGLFQRSVKDARSGKIVEGEGGVRVMVSGRSRHDESKAGVKSALASERGHQTGVDAQAKISQEALHRRSSHGDGEPTRVVESGWDLLDNNEVNFLMAFSMSMGAIVVASWYWEQPMSGILRL